MLKRVKYVIVYFFKSIHQNRMSQYKGTSNVKKSFQIFLGSKDAYKKYIYLENVCLSHTLSGNSIHTYMKLHKEIWILFF